MLFCLQLEASCLQWSFLLTIDRVGAFLLTIGAFHLQLLSFTYSWSFLAYNGKVRLISDLRDCKQRSLTVSKQAPTASKKASPLLFPKSISPVLQESLLAGFYNEICLFGRGLGLGHKTKTSAGVCGLSLA